MQIISKYLDNENFIETVCCSKSLFSRFEMIHTYYARIEVHNHKSFDSRQGSRSSKVLLGLLEKNLNVENCFLSLENNY